MIIALHKRGFTLIEILVVVSLVGILAAVIFANFNGAREEAQNKSLRAELKEVQLALELYKSQNGEYPPASSAGGGCSGTGPGIETANTLNCGNNDIIVGLVPDFLPNLPSHTESGNSNCNIEYIVDSANHSWYKLTAKNCYAGATGSADGIKSDDEFARCPDSCSSCSGGVLTSSSDFYETMSVYSAGGECI